MEERKPDYQRRAAFEFAWAIMGHYATDFPRLVGVSELGGSTGLDAEIHRQCGFYLPINTVKALQHTLTMLAMSETREWVKEKQQNSGKDNE